MTSDIEGWPYAHDKRRGKDLQTQFKQAGKALFLAEKKMRRAFNAYEKAHRAYMRVVKQLNRERPE